MSSKSIICACLGFKVIEAAKRKRVISKATPRSTPFKAMRRQRHLEAAEDYTELIADLIESKGEARTCDIAHQLGISHVTALRTLKRLQREKFVKTSQHQPVDLTAKGRKTARLCKQRHKLLFDFFVSIGVPRNVAEIDVEGVEHHISTGTLKAIKIFMSH